MAASVMGNVINLHALGATVRLDDGRLAAAPLADVEAHRASYQRSLTARKKLPFAIREEGFGRSAILATETMEEPAKALPTAPPVVLTDDVFEERLADYLRETEEWAPPDRPQPFERHLTKKRRRAAQFSSEDDGRQKYRGGP
jgi:hypothetical protein